MHVNNTTYTPKYWMIVFVIWLFGSSLSPAELGSGRIIFLATLFKGNYLIWAIKSVSRMRQKHNCRFIFEGVRMIHVCSVHFKNCKENNRYKH